MATAELHRLVQEQLGGGRGRLEAFFRQLDARSVEQETMRDLSVDLTIQKSDGTAVANFRSAEALLHRVWEKLNTGHWREVDAFWRRLYAGVALLKVLCVVELAQEVSFDEPVSLTADLIKMCDLGLFMGEPILDGLADRLATRLCRFCHERPDTDEGEVSVAAKRVKRDDDRRLPVPELPGRVEQTPRLTYLAVEDFVAKYKSDAPSARPVVITGMMETWPAMDASSASRWTVERLKRVCGPRLFPVELGQKYTSDAWTQTLMTMDEFVERYIYAKSAVKGYLAQHQLLDQIQELMRDVEVPDYCYTGGGDDDDTDGDSPDVNVWFGPEGTVSPLHTDPHHNVLCQVVGRKFVRLYPADQTDFVYPYDGEVMLSNTSRVDLENVDRVKFPLFVDRARGFECVLDEGDMLYIPPKCWHFVKSLSVSLSVSFWFK